MRIAVSTADTVSICGHLGHCSKFFIYEIKDGAILSRQIREVTPVHGPQGAHHGEHHQGAGHHGSHTGLVGSLSDCSAVITNGMGGGMIASLKSAGIDPVITSETDPDVAVKAYIEGSLQRASHGCSECGGHH